MLFAFKPLARFIILKVTRLEDELVVTPSCQVFLILSRCPFVLKIPIRLNERMDAETPESLNPEEVLLHSGVVANQDIAG